MGNEQEQEEEDIETLLFQRIDEYQKKFISEKEKYSNMSKLFRDVFFISEGQKIDNIVFFDNGRTEEFRPLEEQVNRPVGIFDTTVSDPQNDKVLASIINEMKKKYKVIIPSDYPNRNDLDEQIKKLALSLCKEVKIFYDGNGQNIDERCEDKIKAIKTATIKGERKNSLIFLGEMKGCGVCRHRSILFKLLCDIFGIPCRILRGWIVYQNKSNPHMWNEIVISRQRCFTVDPTNFVIFVPPGARIGLHLVTYMNLGHPHRSMDVQRMTAESLKKLFAENDGLNVQEHLGELIGKGAFGEVRELRGVMIIEKIKWVKKTLAVKEVNITALTRYGSNKERLERIIKKEVDRMFLLQHPNITKVICHFITEMKKERIIRVVMKKYDKNGDQFLRVLEQNEKIDPEKREIEILIFFLEILKGLKYIHSFGIIHFDIKPQNILLNWDEKEMTVSDVVISDFGSSKDEKMNFNLTSAPNITKLFAAPEILEMIHKKSLGQNVSDFVFTTSSDIYSFGVLMGAFLQYFNESEEKKKLMKIQSFCVKKNVNERPQIDEILSCVGEVLNKKGMKYAPPEREVYTWGESDWGVLGHGKEKDEQSSPKLIEKLPISSIDIKNLFCGRNNICVLMSNGSVLSWGSNEDGQIGSDQSKYFSSPSVVLSLPKRRKIVQVVYNHYCSLYLDSEGSVWACGKNEDGLLTRKKSDGSRVTKPIEIISQKMGFSKIVKICSIHHGGSFFGCIDCEGRLFTWGSGNGNGYSLKGHGEEDGRKNQIRPVLVEYFKDIPVRDCKMGSYVTLVLSRNGKVFSFGWKILLGRKLENESSSKSWISTPGIIDELEDKKIKKIKISTGDYHFGVLDSIGNCYLWGIGHSELPTPIRHFYNVSGDLISLEIPSKHRFVQVSCGNFRTIFLLEEKTVNSQIVHHVLTSEDGSIPSVVTEFEDKIVQKVCSRSSYFSVLVRTK